MTQMAWRGSDLQTRVRGIPVLLDLAQRFRVMDEFGRSGEGPSFIGASIKDGDPEA